MGSRGRFAQPLIVDTAPEWRFPYTVALSLGECAHTQYPGPRSPAQNAVQPTLLSALSGCKWAVDGFYTSDITTHFTRQYDIEALLEYEHQAFARILEVHEGGTMWTQVEQFLNAMIQVGLASAQPQPLHPPPAADDDESFHVLIVDRSAATTWQHQAMLRDIRPSTRTHSCHTVVDAIEYLRACHGGGDQIHLVLLDLVLDELDPNTEARAPLEQVLAGPNGFDLATEITRMHDLPNIEFVCKPFVAMCTELHEDVMLHAEKHSLLMPDGSVKGCGAVLAKPFSPSHARVLAEATVL